MGKLLTGILDKSALTSLYDDYNPAFKNLYTIEIYQMNSTSWEYEDISSYIKFHATDVTFGDESLNLSRNPVTKNFQLNGPNAYQRQESLSITWREADDWSVKKYHEKWMSYFYDRDHDNFVSYPTTINGSWETKDVLYRKIKIRLPYSETRDNGYMDIIVFDNVIPKNIGGFSFGWSTTGDIVTHQMEYYVKDWYWESEEVDTDNGEA